MIVVANDDVEKRTVPADQVPEGTFADPAQVVGKVLTVRMVKGQAFNQSCFASEGSGVNLASALPAGMRAVSVSLTTYGGLQGLLYPGSLVDVVVAFRAPSESHESDREVSMTLLQAVQVLAVEDRTVASRDDAVAEGGLISASSRLRKLMVTLMVTPEQAEAVQLAMEHGVISLTMRNPMDAKPFRGTLTSLDDLPRKWMDRPKATALNTDAVDTDVNPEPTVRQWETIVIRGTKTERALLPLPE